MPFHSLLIHILSVYLCLFLFLCPSLLSHLLLFCSLNPFFSYSLSHSTFYTQSKINHLFLIFSQLLFTLYLSFSVSLSGVDIGPADPTVRGGANPREAPEGRPGFVLASPKDLFAPEGCFGRAPGYGCWRRPMGTREVLRGRPKGG